MLEKWRKLSLEFDLKARPTTIYCSNDATIAISHTIYGILIQTLKPLCYRTLWIRETRSSCKRFERLTEACHQMFAETEPVCSPCNPCFILCQMITIWPSNMRPRRSTCMSMLAWKRQIAPRQSFQRLSRSSLNGHFLNMEIAAKEIQALGNSENDLIRTHPNTARRVAALLEVDGQHLQDSRNKLDELSPKILGGM